MAGRPPGRASRSPGRASRYSLGLGVGQGGIFNASLGPLGSRSCNGVVIEVEPAGGFEPSTC